MTYQFIVHRLNAIARQRAEDVKHQCSDLNVLLVVVILFLIGWIVTGR